MEQPIGRRGNGGASATSLGEAQLHELAELRARVEDMNERIVAFIRERPGTSILLALGAGFLIGRLLRS